MGRKKDEKNQMQGLEASPAIYDEIASRGGRVPREAVARHAHRGLDQEVHYLRSQVGRLSKEVQRLTEHRANHVHGADGKPERNGMHIDSLGRYFMRKDGKWFRVHLMATRDFPAGHVQRLVEPKD